MDPLTAGLIGLILIIAIGGVWGTVILKGPMEHLEEEVGFYRELQESKSPDRLSSGDPDA